jgi:FKBP-type peptidyl-prolyl cis-trans isomerase SlyD
MTNQIIGPNKVVSIAYTIKDDQGEVVEYSDLPVTYIHGAGSDLFPQIEAALEGCIVGDQVQVDLSADEAFGQPDPGLTFTDDIENAPEELRFVGAELDAESEKGEILQFRVTEVSDEKITVDANHPLAGKDIRFIVRVTEIRDATKEDFERDTRPALH